jgi:tRNA modification GTPase
LLDEGLALWFPGPNTATGEDLAELHLHGGRAVVAAVEQALAQCPGLRRAEPGEFTRRAFANGRVDLAEAEGLADLLEAETQLQRLAALEMAGGALSRPVEIWRVRLLDLSAQVEAVLDFEDEADVANLPASFNQSLSALADDLESALTAPAAERLREGFRIALGGPPNVGKSTLFNALVESEAAITAPIPGTTRDVLEQSVAISGVPLTLVDMAGLHEHSEDAVEIIGIARAKRELERADLVLWLGPEGEGPSGAWEIEPRIDLSDGITKRGARHRVSAVAGDGMENLRSDLLRHAQEVLRRPGCLSLNQRQRMLMQEAQVALSAGVQDSDLLLLAENLRLVRQSFDRLTGRSYTEDVLDALFGRFCIGK